MLVKWDWNNMKQFFEVWKQDTRGRMGFLCVGNFSSQKAIKNYFDRSLYYNCYKGCRWRWWKDKMRWYHAPTGTLTDIVPIKWWAITGLKGFEEIWKSLRVLEWTASKIFCLFHSLILSNFWKFLFSMCSLSLWSLGLRLWVHSGLSTRHDISIFT